MKGITLQRLEILGKLREGDSLTAVAGSAVRQSQYSRQLRQLEEATGLALVERKGRRLELTRKGYEVWESYNALLHELGHSTAKRKVKEIVVAGGEMALVDYLIPLLGGAFSKLSNTIRFRNMRSIEALRGLRMGEIDLVLSSNKPKRRFENVTKLSECGYLVLNKGSQQVAAGMRVETLVRERLVLLEGQTPLRVALAKEAKKVGLKLKVGVECSTYSQMIEVVAQTGLLAVVPEICVKAANRRELGMRKLLCGNERILYELWCTYRTPRKTEVDFCLLLERVLPPQG